MSEFIRCENCEGQCTSIIEAALIAEKNLASQSQGVERASVSVGRLLDITADCIEEVRLKTHTVLGEVGCTLSYAQLEQNLINRKV